MRIIGGKFGGRKIQGPPSHNTRPVLDQVKEAIFNILGQTLDGRVVLDLFAGTGSLGLEALSRGADHAVFVEKNPAVLAVINQNINSLGLSGLTEVINADLPGGLKRLKIEREPFDLVFIDPPYGYGLVEKTLDFLGRVDLTTNEVMIIAEHMTKEKAEEQVGPWILTDQRIYGQTRVSFFSKDTAFKIT